MTIWAGIDIGNATTEIVLCRENERLDLEILATAATRTRGTKGTVCAMDAAVRLLRRTASTHGLIVERAAFAPTPPVKETRDTVVQTPIETGRLRVQFSHGPTPAGDGSAIGLPVAVSRIPEDSKAPMVVCAPAQWRFDEVAAAVNAAATRGIDIRGIVVSNDEAVLIANRLSTPIPVVDDIPTEPLLSARLVAIEVRQGGGPLRQLSDPLWICAAFGLQPWERAHAQSVAAQLRDRFVGVVALERAARAPLPRESSLPPPGARVRHVDLAQIAASAGTRRGAVETSIQVAASLNPGEETPADCEILADILQAPVTQVGSEGEAARRGAATTPGLTGEFTVVDVGGGTVDVIGNHEQRTVPGAGQLLTLVTSLGLATSWSCAEYAKRGESVRAVSATLVEDEYGRRRFLERPVDGRHLGWLFAQAPGGLLPVTARLAPTEWRAWRLAAKAHVIGSAVVDGTTALNEPPSTLVLVGGGAADEELVRSVQERVGLDVLVARGNVAGSLGFRYAVAYGLVAAAVAQESVSTATPGAS